MTGEIVSIPGRTVVYGINRMYKCTNNVKALTSAQSYIYIQAMEFLHHGMSTSSYYTNSNNSTYLSWAEIMF